MSVDETTPILREVHASGERGRSLATELLHRVRRAQPDAGMWEAADLQWWSRQPRTSDGVDQLFWVDEHGPAAGVVFTAWKHAWACDPIVVPGGPVPVGEVVRRAADHLRSLELASAEVLASDDDRELLDALEDTGTVTAGERSGTTWMATSDLPPPLPLPDGFVIVDRVGRDDEPHPMRHRNGAEVAARLAACSLYDPALDLAIRAPDGEVAGYALFWADPVTQVGLVEPVRVEDAHQRQGLARALVAAGLERLAARGMRRMKVGYDTDAARSLYLGLGFRQATTDTTYRWQPR